MILDGDTGGLAEHFVFQVRTLERLGVSAVIIEDKIGPKKTRSSERRSNRSRITRLGSRRRSEPGRNPRSRRTSR